MYPGISPRWPVSYDEMEPYYTKAELTEEAAGQHIATPRGAGAATVVERLRQLLDRLQGPADPGVRELILATSFTAEGETTAHAISQMARTLSIKVTRLARGVPIGSELEYVDLGTIAHALVDRR